MRLRSELLLASILSLLAPVAARPAAADHAPAIVVPGRPDVPVIIDGVDATWAVVDGDWGLYRGGHRGVTIESGILLSNLPPPPNVYYPATGRRPRYGRHEFVPPSARRALYPAEGFLRSWTTESSGPVIHERYPPFDPPPVIKAPRLKY